MRAFFRTPRTGPKLSGRGGRRGFTLLEMLISLIIGTIIVGGVMGLISVSMQHSFRLKDKAQIQPILETAAQTILDDPKRIADGSITFGDKAGSPIVAIRAIPVQVDPNAPPSRAGELYRVMLSYRGSHLEFSIIVPPDNR